MKEGLLPECPALCGPSHILWPLEGAAATPFELVADFLPIGCLLGIPGVAPLLLLPGFSPGLQGDDWPGRPNRDEASVAKFNVQPEREYEGSDHMLGVLKHVLFRAVPEALTADSPLTSPQKRISGYPGHPLPSRSRHFPGTIQARRKA